MFNKVYKWLGSKIIASQQDKEKAEVPMNKLSGVSVSRGFSGETAPLELRIHRATGGAVLEFRTYDPIRDHSKTELYVIPEGDDFAERMSSHIQMEYLKRA